MKIEIIQSVQQQQILAPQMILSMDILLLTHQELEARIEKEFMENPALEIQEGVSPEGTGADAAAPVAPEASGPQDTIVEHLGRMADYLPALGPDGLTARRRGGDGSDFDKQEALQNLEGQPPGLREHLRQQLHLLSLAPPVVELGDFVIDNLDERGYLLHPVEDLKHSLEPPLRLEDFDAALEAVRSLDPPGVAAESLQECLILQLERDGQSYPLEIEILRHHISDLERNKIPKIAHELGRTIDDIKEALELIALLEPFPGNRFAKAPTQAVRPDVIVDEVDGKYQIKVEDGQLPPLAISESCRQLLREARGNREVADFLRKRIDSAQWLIQAVAQRRRTLHDITRAILDYQKDFVQLGPSCLRAMKMQTIADLVGVHISTISRAIRGKYIQTPRGIFELRYFFTGGVERDDGEIESRRNVYRRIAELIASENKRRPLSDTAIAKQLQTEGLDIARRTVTKYRDQEKIPPSRLRKEY